MAESEILSGGQWEPRRFPASGAVHVAIMGPRDAGLRLEVEGLQAQLRRQSASDGAFSLGGAEEGVTIVATASTGEAFPGGAIADLSLSFPGARRDYLVEQIDISGRRSAPLVRLVPEEGQWVLSPAEPGMAGAAATGPAAAPAPAHRTAPAPVSTAGPGAPAHAAAASAGAAAPAVAANAAPVPEPAAGSTVPELLGAWVGRRRRDAGAAVAPEVSEIRIDRSVSMDAHGRRADVLRDFLCALARAGGGQMPAVADAIVGGVSRYGVGSVALSSRDAGSDGRSLVITDVPVGQEGVASLVLGDPRILEALPSEDAFAVTPEIWQELEREDASFDDSTLRRMEPLVDWITAGATSGEVRA